MTVQSTVSRISYLGNGAVDTYAYTFRILDEDDLVVIVTDDMGVETTLTKTTDYTVTGVGLTAGGNVVLVDASQDWLDVDGDLLTDYTITILRVREILQQTDIRNQGSFLPETHEETFDHLIMVDQQQEDAIARSMKLPPTVDPADFDTQLPASVVDNPGVTLVVNATGDGFDTGPTSAGVAADVAAAAASAAAALVSENNAATSETNAGISETNAAASAAAAAVSETNAATSASDSAASAVAAAAAADSVIWNDVEFITFADSPLTIVDADRGKLFAVDASGGAVTINLPGISGLTFSTPWAIGIKKTDSGLNTVTVSPNGSDEIDESGSDITISDQNSGYVFIPDTDTAPDTWVTAAFGFAGSGSTNPAVTTKTANYTLTSADDLVLANATGGAFTLTIPAAASNSGKVFTIKNISTNTNAVNFARSGSDLIEGLTSQQVTMPETSVVLQSDGVSNWYLI